MDEHISIVIKEAEKTFEDAKFLLEGKRYGSAINRAYYAAFHCAQALIRSKEIFTKTHAGTHSKFGELFVKTDLFPKDIGEYLKRLAGYRTAADYTYEVSVSPKIASQSVDYAQKFLAQTKKYFEEQDSIETDKEE